MKIIISCGFPYDNNRGNYVHSEEQDGVLFVSKELLDEVKKYLIDSDGFITVHRDHSAVYSSSDPEDERR